MKVIENPDFKKQSPLSGGLGKVLGALAPGKPSPDAQAEEMLVSALSRLLDNRFILLRNVVLSGVDVTIPLVLVGPTGAYMLYTSAIRGVFRAAGENWEQLDERSQSYKPVRPNLITRVSLMSRAVETYLLNRGKLTLVVEPVLFLMDPGAHVELNRPNARIFRQDGLDRFAASLLQGALIMGKEQVQAIVEALIPIRSAILAGGEEALIEDTFSMKEEQAKPAVIKPVRPPRDDKIASTLNKAPFSSRQMLALGCLALVNIVILVAFLIIVLVLK
ncbi:MAG: NERD domain-containing protein [Anaerolineales bacterium]|nr:NERD domain-containing protein [Anaerolineales bacterium]